MSEAAEARPCSRACSMGTMVSGRIPTVGETLPDHRGQYLVQPPKGIMLAVYEEAAGLWAFLNRRTIVSVDLPYIPFVEGE